MKILDKLVYMAAIGTLASCFYATEAQAIQTYTSWGIAVAHPDKDASADKNKYVEFGIQKAFKVFDTRWGIGGWTDKTKYPGASHSVYTHYQLGLETRNREGFYTGFFIGPSYISNPDTLLSSHLQFSQSVEVGWGDTRGVRIALIVKHLSNAGLKTPNKGRNFVGLQVRF